VRFLARKFEPDWRGRWVEEDLEISDQPTPTVTPRKKLATVKNADNCKSSGGWCASLRRSAKIIAQTQPPGSRVYEGRRDG